MTSFLFSLTVDKTCWNDSPSGAMLASQSHIFVSVVKLSPDVIESRNTCEIGCLGLMKYSCSFPKRFQTMARHHRAQPDLFLSMIRIFEYDGVCGVKAFVWL